MEKKTYAGILVKHKNKCLLCKRNNEDSYPNTWSLPGGKVESGENTKNAAIREFLEETNILLNKDDIRFIGVIPRNNNHNMDNTMYLYMIEVDKKVIPDLNSAIDGHEHTECGYFTIDEMSELNYDVDLYDFLTFFLKKM